MRILCILVLFGFLGSVRGNNIISNADIERAARNHAGACKGSIIDSLQIPNTVSGPLTLVINLVSSQVSGVSCQQNPEKPDELTLSLNLTVEFTVGTTAVTVEVAASISTKPEAVNGELTLTVSSPCRCKTQIVNIAISLKGVEGLLTSTLSEKINPAVNILLRTVLAQVQLALSVKNRAFDSGVGQVTFVLDTAKATVDGLTCSLSVILNGKPPISLSTITTPVLKLGETGVIYLSANVLAAALSLLKTTHSRPLTPEECKKFGDRSGLTLSIEINGDVGCTITTEALLTWSALVKVDDKGTNLLTVEVNITVGGNPVAGGNAIGIKLNMDSAKYKVGKVTPGPNCQCQTVTADLLLFLNVDLRAHLQLYSCRGEKALPRPPKPAANVPANNKECTCEPGNARCGVEEKTPFNT